MYKKIFTSIFTMMLVISPLLSYGQTYDLQDIDINYIKNCQPTDTTCLILKQTFIELIVELIEDLREELEILKQQEAEKDDSEDESGKFIDADNLDDDSTYRVRADLNLSGISNSLFDQNAKKIWDLFLDIAPEEYVKDYVANFRVYNDEDDDFAAFVQLNNATYPKWNLSVNLDKINLSSKRDKDDLVEVLIHEFSHILTLNQSQVNEDTRESRCSGYYTDEGCFYEDTLMNRFVSLFWGTDDLVEQGREALDIEDQDERDDFVAEFYDGREDEFVTEYAATSPEEDIAESFTEFIYIDLEDVEGKENIAEEKVSFFTMFDELIGIRNNIRSIFSL